MAQSYINYANNAIKSTLVPRAIYVERYETSGSTIMKRTITLIGLLLLSGKLLASDLPQTFKELESLYVGRAGVIYNPLHTEVINKEFTEEESGIEVTRAIRTRIDARQKTSYIVDYDEGVSVDPAFTIYKEGDKGLIKIGTFNGLELVIPGNGNIYISGHTNNMFNMRLKYQLAGDSFIEVKQPYYYVGADSVTKADITLYESPGSGAVVALLTKETKITVLLNKGKYYLIKTPFGLTGWYHMKHEYPIGVHDKSELEGIYFNGD